MVCKCMYVCVCVCLCMYVNVCVWMCMYVHVCVYMCVYVCICVCMHACMHEAAACHGGLGPPALELLLPDNPRKALMMAVYLILGG